MGTKQEENQQLKQELDKYKETVQELQENNSKIFDECLYYRINYNELKQQLALTEKALKLAREYMFNVMCADDVPFESWFIECAKNDWKTS